jgi:hypothetical protein
MGAEPEPASGGDASLDPAPVGPPPEPVPSFPAYTPRYRSSDELAAFLAELARGAPSEARLFELGRTPDGRAVEGLEFGAPGDPPPAERPTVFLIGGLDGRSQAGAEAVLASAHRLLSRPLELPFGVNFVALPWLSGEDCAAALPESAAPPSLDGRNGRPLDDDRDGLADEDGPDDLDGDGLVLDMLVEDPAGPWSRGPDGRFLVPAAPGGERFAWTREGRDDDGDGLFNEDPRGGVVLDRNFPVNRLGPWEDPRGGSVAMSEPLSRALADLVLGRRAAVVVLFQGNHGALAAPGGVAGGAVDTADDRELFETVTQAFAAATGREQSRALSLAEAHGRAVRGAALDWIHAVAGALAVEVAPWGPRVERRGEGLREGHAGVALRDARYAEERGSGGEPALLGSADSAWASWLDNTRGGLGFVDWQPVELERGRKGWVGGWEPRTIHDPPEDSLGAALTGLADFSAGLAGSLPVLEIQVTRLERDGELLRLDARVHNRGRLPTGLAGTGVGVELGLPGSAELVAGNAIASLPRLAGGESSRELAWVLVAPPDSLVVLSARADWAADVRREVRR